MFCPICKAEYRFGFTHCSECDVDLVESLAAAQPASDLALAWRGSDPVAFSAALAALRDAGIADYQLADHDQLVWGLAIPRPRNAIWVLRSDLEPALECVKGINERPALALGKTPEWALEEDHADQSAGSDRGEDRRDVPDDLVPVFKADDAKIEVWSGEQAEIPQMLEASLRENGITCVVEESDGKKRILVLPAAEAQAREIVREVIEGTPLE